MCSVIYKNFLFFDYILTDLETQIDYRNEKQTKFSDDQLWILADNIINGVLALHEKGIAHNCLKPRNVYLGVQRGYKIIDPVLFNYDNDYDQVFHERDQTFQDIYLSPAQVKGLERNIEIPIHDKFKSDVFSAGIVILCAATMGNCDSCFDYYHGRVYQDKLDEKINSIQSVYHDQLVYLIKDMVLMNEVDRPEMKALSERIQRNGAQALNKTLAKTNLNVVLPDGSVAPPVGGYNQGSQMTNTVMFSKLNKPQESKIMQEYELGFTKPFDYSAGIDVSKMANPSYGAGVDKYQAQIDEILGKNSMIGGGAGGYDLGGIGGYGYTGLGNYNSPMFDLNSSMTGLNLGGGGIGGFNLGGNSGAGAFSSYGGLGASSTRNVLEKQQKNRQVVYEKYSNGSKYEGEKKNGQRNGHGKYIYQDGGYYEGQWKDNKMNGVGTFHFPDGSVAYDGHWKEDQFHGHGVVYNNDHQMFSGIAGNNLSDGWRAWIKYQGDFKNDKKEGFGTIWYSNGDKYVGGFKGDCIHGQGSFFKSNDTNQPALQGIWQNNTFLQKE